MRDRRTNSFLILKEHSQSTLDFAVLVCAAVPQLRYALGQYDIDNTIHLVENKSFRNSGDHYSTERRTMGKYKTVLGANILISNFSFFESYFFSAIDEIIAYHGGKDEYLEFVRSQVQTEPLLTKESEKLLNQLRKKYDGKKIQRYRKYSELVKDENIVWPSEKLAHYGLKQIISNRNRWKSADIPNLITDLLTLDLHQNISDKYHSIRNDRNKIAHGAKLSYTLEKALEANSFLYDLAKKIDHHIVDHFMIIERYR